MNWKRIGEIALTVGSKVSGIPADQIFAASKDGTVVVLNDGTKVSDEIFKQAKIEEARARKQTAATAEQVASQLASLPPEELEKLSSLIARASQANAGEPKKPSK